MEPASRATWAASRHQRIGVLVLCLAFTRHREGLRPVGMAIAPELKVGRPTYWEEEAQGFESLSRRQDSAQHTKPGCRSEAMGRHRLSKLPVAHRREPRSVALP
jgi:hypothetical protein